MRRYAKMIDEMDEFLAAAVPAILQLITGLTVMCWLFGGEDRRKENRKK